jgi:hypothetical protein
MLGQHLPKPRPLSYTRLTLVVIDGSGRYELDIPYNYMNTPRDQFDWAKVKELGRRVL